MPLTDPSTLLRDAALRVTRPRLAVLEQLHHHPHADADTIAQAVRADLGKVSTQAVYDVLAALTDAGLVRRIEPAGSPARYEMRVGDNHHHAICRECGVIADVDCAVGERPCLHASDTHGFAIDEAEVIYWGRCPSCIEDLLDRTPVDGPGRASTAADETAAAASVSADLAQRHTKSSHPSSKETT